MRRILCALTIAVALTAAAGAITYGIPDGNAHPNVGLFIAKIDNAYYAICSGTLVSERVFLTAGHCTEALRQLGGEAYVTFASAPPYSVASFVHGTAYTHPEYGKSFPNTADLGVIVLNTPVTGILPARVPSAGFLDELSTQRGLSSAYFTHVGYGTQSVRPRYIAQVVRYQGISDLVNLVSAWTDGFNLQTTANPGKGRSGVCFGDSGGPTFFEGSDVVVGVHSFVKNDNCKGTAFSYRVDLPISLDFLAEFGVAPSF
jgi:secreted trypsin-like serine protease